MTGAPSLDMEHLRRWIGRQDVASERATADLVRRFRATFDDDTGGGVPGAAAPRLLHWCLAQPSAPTHALGPDGHPARGGFLPPVPLPRRMWAGGSLAFRGDIAMEDEVRRLGGKLAIHPRQVAAIRVGFASDAAEISWAERVLASGDGAVSVDGTMVDEPVRIRARAILSRRHEGAG